MKKLPMIVLATVTLCGAAHAETMKPGLWEIQNKTAVNGQAMPDMEEMMKDVPPEMRAQMEQAMSKNGAAAKGKGMQVCVTPEQAENNDISSNQPESCKVTDQSRSGSTQRMKIQCTNPKSEGETEMTFSGGDSWTSKTTMTIEEDGQRQKIVSEASGKWLSADCGSVAPARSQK